MPESVAAVLVLVFGMLIGAGYINVLAVRRRSIIFEEMDALSTQVARLEGQRYAALPAVRQIASLTANEFTDTVATERLQELLLFLERTILQPTHLRDNEGAILIPDLAILDMLADIWERQASEYPDTEVGQYTRVSVEQCAAELRAVVHDDQSFTTTSVLDAVAELQEAS